jgi:type II secretory pathway component PulF
LFFIVLGWTFIAFGLLVALNVFGILVLIIVALVFRRLRRARQQALLWTLAVAAERSIPLVPAIEAFADERSGPARQETRVLARLLKAGTPLPDALSIVGGMVPEEAVVPIQVGQELGALDQGLRQATAPTGPYQAVWDQLAGKVAYLCFLVLFASSVITFIMLKIAPAFQKIFMDFGADLPAVTQFTMHLASFAARTPLASLVCVFLVWLFVYAILRYIGAVSWDLPLMGRLVRRMHAARVLESLAMAVERNQPLFKTVATLARCYPKPSIRRRLQVVLVDVTSGVDVVESLRSRGLISRADTAVLHAAQRVGNLAWAMREIADSHRRRLAYRVQAWLQILFPAAILSFGLMVLLLVAGYFLPLVALIQKLS